MTTKELRTAVNNEIKSLGLKRSDVSVSVKIVGFEDAIRVQAKHEDVDLALLDKTLKKFNKIDRCERSGEILSGGNVYLTILDVNGYTANWSKF